MPTRVNRKVCFISGAGHSGSTLLGLILGSHSECFYCGEAAKTRFLQDQTQPLRKRVCKICGPSCPIWKDLVIDSGIDLYEQVSVKTQKPVLIDSSKNINWLERQLNTLKATTSQPFLIFLHRDGRAVINSRIKKYPEQPVEKLIENWVRQIKITRNLFEQFSCKKMKVQYEILATEPAKVIKKLCDFLEINYQQDMLDYYKHEQHPLGGNSGTQFLVAKAQSEKIKEPFLQLSEPRRDYYQAHRLGISLDLRWQQELDPNVIRLFEEMAGQDNTEFKWEA